MTTHLHSCSNHSFPIFSFKPKLTRSYQLLLADADANSTIGMIISILVNRTGVRVCVLQ